MSKVTKLGILIGTLMLFSGLNFGQNNCPNYSSKFKNSFQVTNIEEKAFYEVGKNYLLKADFNEDCELVEIKVVPKSWKLPEFLDENTSETLSVEEYKSLLGQISQIRSLGSLISSEKVGIVTNSKTWIWNQYQEALVEHSFTTSFVNEVIEPRVVSFSILFKHKVKGKVRDKVKANDSNILYRCKIQIDESWYWCNPDNRDRRIIGKKGQFEVYGLPINN